MRPFLLTALVAATSLASVSGIPRPQVSADDVLASASGAARYGQNSGSVDQSLIDELFGGGSSKDQNYVPPAKQTVNDEYDECEHPVYRKQGFECVPYYQCDEFGEIITNGGGGLIDIRGNFGDDTRHNVQLDPENSKCPGDLEVCCRHANFSGEPVTGPPISTTTTTLPPPPKYVSRCGRRNYNGVGVRIQNNPNAAHTQFGEWPHMCAILREDGNRKNLFVGGASLIGEDLILTAAHKIAAYDPSELTVRCGEWDTQNRVEPKIHQDRRAEVYIMHPGFDSKTLYNDVAVLKVRTPFILDEHVDVMCLPDFDDLGSYDDRDCVATGWGKDQFGEGGEYQVIMKQVALDLVRHNDCQTKLRTTKLGRNFRLHDSFLCAGGEAGQDTCKGDGGGPLVCPLNNQPDTYVQVGLVAWGIGCGEDGIPGVYASIEDSLCFIDWALGCVSGNSVSCPSSQCNGWKSTIRRDFLSKLTVAQDRLDQYPGDYEDRAYKRLESKFNKAQELMNHFEDQEDACDAAFSRYSTQENEPQYRNAYNDCFTDDDGESEYEYTDISDYSRTGAGSQPDLRSDNDEEDFVSKKAESEDSEAAEVGDSTK